MTKKTSKSSVNQSRKSSLFFLIILVLVIGLICGYLLKERTSSYKKESQTFTVSPTNIMQKETSVFESKSQDLEVSILKGYYRKYDGTKWEWGNQPVSCDSLVTTGGSEELIKEFKTSAEAGNTLNKIIDNNFYINIDLSSLTDSERTLVEESSETRPIELSIKKKVVGGRGVSTCFSLIDIVSVKSSK